MTNIISPISIDLGAKFTGVFSTTAKEGEINEKTTNKNGFVVVTDEKIRWSLINRRVKRHQKRNLKRRKLAKRLFWVILDGVYGISIDKLNKEVVNLLNGFFNRRGFTYQPKQGNFVICDKAQDIDIAFFVELLPELLSVGTESIKKQLSKIKELPSEISVFDEKNIEGEFKQYAKEKKLHTIS